MTGEQTRQALAERTTGNVQPGNRDREQLEAFALMRARSRIEALEAENERLRKIIELDERFAKEVGDWLGGKKTARNLGVVFFEHRDAQAALKGDSHE